MPQEIQFWDQSKRLDWFRARALARKIVERPEILNELRECIEKYWGDDPSKYRSLRIWRGVPGKSPEGFARFLLADKPEAEEARKSYPPFVALTPQERAAYIEASRREVALA